MSRLGFGSLTSLVFSFITISNLIYNRQEQYDRITARSRWNDQYDYIIVGGGTAGSVLASRLSEDASISVLLIEAGGSETVSSNTPALADTLLGSMVDWKFTSIPQDHSCLAMNDRQCLLSAGRVIGGTSAINRMYYLRSNPSDFDHWGNKLGLKSWAWKDTAPYIIRNENQTDSDRAKSGYFGLNGPVSVGRGAGESTILNSFIASSKSTGYRLVDLNTGTSSGTSLLQSTTKDGHRVSMSTAFLEPYLKRSNLHIISNSVVFQIIFEANQATGVKFYRNWKSYLVYAKKEVVLSAGALNTPKLLMLSGIGPEEELTKHHIPIVANLPVGENLHDHVGTMGLHFTVSIPEVAVDKQNLKDYFQKGKGPLAEYQCAATVFRSSVGQDLISRESSFSGQDSPDVMLLAFANTIANRDMTPALMQQRTNLHKDIWNSYYSHRVSTGRSQLTIVPTVLKPKSRGWVRLRSPNPFDPPLINPNYLQHQSDVEQIIKGIREALRIVNARSLQRIHTELLESIVPGCEQYAPASKPTFKHSLNNPSEPSTVAPETTTTTLTSPPTSSTMTPPKPTDKNRLLALFRRLFVSSKGHKNALRRGRSSNEEWIDATNTTWKEENLIDGFSSYNDVSFIQTVWSSHQGPKRSTTRSPTNRIPLIPTEESNKPTDLYSDPGDHFSNQYLQCMARRLTMPMGDYVGTCRMGGLGDRRRVVDTQFRVVGIDGLRVVDTSVVPEITTGAMASMAVMIGERAAEYIQNDHN